MKKILASVLAAASILTMTVSASAATTTDKTVTKPGEITYDVPVTAPKVVLNLVMPAKMQASLNPYGAEIKLEDKDTGYKKSTKGIASVGYKVTNKSKDYGVYLDATAITTVTTTDKTKWTVTGLPNALTAGTKGASMGLLAVDALADDPTPIASKAATSTGQGALLLDSTVVADRTNGVAAGQTKQAKMAFVKAAVEASGTTTDGEVYLVFAGDLAKSAADGSADVIWNEDDAINVNLVLKVVAGPKTL